MSNDSQLQSDVLAELKWEPSVDAAHIGVTANASVVTLTGHVENYLQKSAAERAAKRVKGVKGVAEELEVRLPFSIKHDDEAIAGAAINRLAWDSSVGSDSVMVKVEKGWVTLTGETEWHFQKRAAEHGVRGLLGVVGVSNQITIKPRVNVSNLSDEIMCAMHRSWFSDPRTVNVSETDGKVKLTGTVDSLHDWDAAASTAWAAPGVTSVQNDLRIAL